MIIDEKISFRKSVTVMLCIDLCSFLFFYIFGYLLNYELTGYIAYFANLLLSSAMSPIMAVCMLFFYRGRGYKSAFLKLCPLVLLRLIYLIPSNYIYYMNYGYDTADSLLLTALRSLALIVLIYVEAALLFLLILFILKKFAMADSESLDNMFFKDSLFDFSSKLTLAIFISALPRFLINLIKEIKTIVQYLTDYSGTYRAEEIIYMLFSLIFILAVLLITHFAAVKLKLYIAHRSLYEECDSKP